MILLYWDHKCIIYTYNLTPRFTVFLCSLHCFVLFYSCNETIPISTCPPPPTHPTPGSQGNATGRFLHDLEWCCSLVIKHTTLKAAGQEVTLAFIELSGRAEKIKRYVRSLGQGLQPDFYRETTLSH